MLQADHSEALDAFLDQVSTLVRERRGSADPWRELDLLGLLPGSGQDAMWDVLGPAQWLVLLRGVACACPHLAAGLAAVRQVHLHGGDVRRHGWIHAARLDANGQWQCALPAAPTSLTAWYFLDGDTVRQVGAARLQPCGVRNGLHLASAVPQDCKAAGPALAGPGGQAELAALLTGVLYRLWEQACVHAESRPMFRRRLADFPAIRWRLIGAMGDVLRADEVALRLARHPAAAGRHRHAGALRRLAQAVRVELQQVCGGTGYMQESAFADTLAWFDWCDSVARQVPSSDAPLAPQELHAIERRVLQRFEAAGVASGVWLLAAGRGQAWA